MLSFNNTKKNTSMAGCLITPNRVLAKKLVKYITPNSNVATFSIKHQIELYHQNSSGQKLQHHTTNNVEQQLESHGKRTIIMTTTTNMQINNTL